MVSNISELKTLFEINAKRFIDRDKNMNIKKDIEDDGDDEVNTKQLTQDELNELYTGDEFSGEESFSRMISIMLVCLTYSAGMPLMYFVGFVFFFTTFIVNKIMLITYLQKTTKLSRVTPNYSLRFLNLGIFIHMCFGCVMFTNPPLFKTSDEPEIKPPNLFPFFEEDWYAELEKTSPVLILFRIRT